MDKPLVAPRCYDDSRACRHRLERPRRPRPIAWKGEWQGKPYEDKGVILRMLPHRLLQYSHFSPLAGQRDTPENYHTVTVELAEQPGGTRVSLSQDNNATATDQSREHSEKNWRGMLAGLKKVLET